MANRENIRATHLSKRTGIALCGMEEGSRQSSKERRRRSFVTEFNGGPANLDEETQRRLVIQAAKQVGGNVFKEMKKKQPTLLELDSGYSTHLWVFGIGGFLMFFPWLLMPMVVLPLYKVRRAVTENWGRMLASP